MLRVVTVLLVLATPTITGAADSSHAFTDLRNEMSAAKTQPEQRAVIARMREALRDGAVPAAQVSAMIFGLSEKPVFNEAATISFLQELIATPGTAEATTTGEPRVRIDDSHAQAAGWRQAQRIFDNRI